ncbi:MAG: hypothetical protein E7425_08110, partial [Ruminococcaceae bacterium]|nr:hypothetical protein [Oscillospiraceae bacterium]
MSINGRDTIIIDDTGVGSTTGASRVNTANWRSGSTKKEKEASKSAAAKQERSSLAEQARKPTQRTQEKQLFDTVRDALAYKPAAESLLPTGTQERITQASSPRELRK